MTRSPVFALFVALALPCWAVSHAQDEGSVPTQVLVEVETNSPSPIRSSALALTVNYHTVPIDGWTQVEPTRAQVALLIDDGLRSEVGRELDNLRSFVLTLPPGIEVLIGSMQHGTVVVEQPFTADHALAASALRLPDSIAGISASPYICLSDFVKHWPEAGAPNASNSAPVAPHKARFVLMLSDGVDPYNGSTSVMNQGSPYVDTAISDAQRAGVAVYAIYFADAGIYGGSANISGQDYLTHLTLATGGVDYWEGMGNPVSSAPFLRKFQSALAETYIATFNAPTGKDYAHNLVEVKFNVIKPPKPPKSKNKVKLPKVKGLSIKTTLAAPEKVHPGNVE
jgi:hypothetical protein